MDTLPMAFRWRGISESSIGARTAFVDREPPPPVVYLAYQRPVLPAVVVPTPVVATQAPVVVAMPDRKPAKRGAEAFWQLRRAAVEAIRTVYGDHWGIKAPRGETVLAIVPRGWRCYKTARGTVIRYRADHRLPAAQYWPGGELPAGLVLGTDPARETAPAPRKAEPVRSRNRKAA